MLKADKQLKKTQVIREAFLKFKRPMNIDEIRGFVEKQMKQIINEQKLYTLLSMMIHSKEVDTVGRGDNRFYHLVRARA